MIKKSTLLFFISIILLSELVSAQQLPFYGDKKTTNALSMLELSGKVKSVEQTVFIAKDSMGKIIKEERKFDYSGSINTDFLIQLDSTGKSIKENYSSGKTLLKVTHKYDNIKNTETVEQYSAEYKNGNISQRTVYKYNIDGNIMQIDFTQFFTNNSPNFNSKGIYKYDAKKNLIEYIYFAPNEKPLKTILKNDDKGNKVSTTSYSEEGRVWSRETFKTDVNGNISEHAYYITDTNNVEHSFTYKYDKNNNVIEKNYFKPDTKSKKYTYTYEYDKAGNWIKRTDFEDDKAILIAERKFEYY